MKIYISIIFQIILQISILSASNSKESVFDDLKSKYLGITSLQVKFYNNELNLDAEIIALRGDKYKMIMQDRTIVCNAKFVWNYSKSDKTVVVSKFDKSNSEISLESIFFSISENFTPVQLTEINSSKYGKARQLTLQPKANVKQFKHVKLVNLILDNNGNPSLVKIEFEKYDIAWEIIDLKTNIDISSKDFEFKPPKDVEMIDLR